MLEAGRLAPTAKNLQEQRVYVLESDEALAKFDKLNLCRHGVPVVFVIAFNNPNTYVYPDARRDSGIEDASIVATHMLLASKDFSRALQLRARRSDRCPPPRTARVRCGRTPQAMTPHERPGHSTILGISLVHRTVRYSYQQKRAEERS